MVLNGDGKSGVALIIRAVLERFVRKKLVDGERGRLVGVVLELSSGVKVVIMAVYIPTGRDSDADGDSEASKATNDVYARLMRWSYEGDVCILAGDFNETLSSKDSNNISRKKVNQRGSWLSSLAREYVDCYRALHKEGGYTFASWTHEKSWESRLDYIFVKSDTSKVEEVEVRACEVENQLKVPGGHKLLWSELSVDVMENHLSEFFKEPTINLTRASEEQLVLFAEAIEKALSPLASHIKELLSGENGVQELTEAGDLLNSVVYKVACTKLGTTGGDRLQSRTMLHLKKRLEHNNSLFSQLKFFFFCLMKLILHRLPGC